MVRYEIECADDYAKLARYVEGIKNIEILSIGDGLELVKDLGDANQVSESYSIGNFKGSHGIGHCRMATESDVDISSAHPFWAFPFKDLAVVHNGQLTNYWSGRRDLERRGHHFSSDCDSELISVYLAEKIEQGVDLEAAMHQSIDDFDGVFTYVVATDRMLGLAKDRLHAKPMVLYESDDLIALASEEVAIRSVLQREIDTTDPYEGTVMVWETSVIRIELLRWACMTSGCEGERSKRFSKPKRRRTSSIPVPTRWISRSGARSMPKASMLRRSTVRSNVSCQRVLDRSWSETPGPNTPSASAF
jgi:glutamate synthase domain-containing protein 1